MSKKSIWNDDSSPYGTYEGEPGNPEQWAATFSFTFENSESVQSILGMSAYTILNVAPSISDEDLKKTFKRLAKKYHPDKGITGNEEKFRQVVEAYKMIKSLRHPTMPTVTVNPKANRQSTPEPEPNVSLVVPQLLTPIDEDELERYLTDTDFGCQEKKDGKHITMQILDGELIVRNKKGITCGSAPDYESSIRSAGIDLLIDGEQIGRTFWVWDLLEYDGNDLRDQAYFARYMKLKDLSFGPAIKILPLTTATEMKRAMFERMKETDKEGVVFKRLSGRFFAGRTMDQLKFKFWATASVIVVPGREGRSSIGMELFNEEGEREHVGYCSCNQNPPIGSIAEIKYLYAFRGGCLYQSSFKELRDDVDIEECTTSQLKYKAEE